MIAFTGVLLAWLYFVGGSALVGICVWLWRQRDEPMAIKLFFTALAPIPLCLFAAVVVTLATGN